MRIVLEVLSGPRSGHKFLLRPFEVVKVGASLRADIVFECDRRMSPLHFQIQLDESDCWLEVLERTQGASLNGELVQERVAIRNGDVLVAGETSFRVDVEGGIGEAPHQHRASDRANPAQDSTGGLSFERCPCASGLLLYRGQAEGRELESLAGLLRNNYRQQLVIDYAKLPTNDWVQALPSLPEQLFNWLPNEAAKSSPIILTCPRQFEALPAGGQLWDKDVLIALFSDKDEPPTLEQIRRAAGAFIRPSVLRPQLMHAPAEIAHDLLLEIEAVLVEGESPQSWFLFSTRDLATVLKQGGLTEAEEETRPSPES